MFPLSVLRVVRHTSPQRHLGIPAPFEVIQQGCPLLQTDNSREMGADITPVSSTSLWLNTVAHRFVLHKGDSLVPPKGTESQLSTPFLSDIIVLIQAALDLMPARPGLMKVRHLFMIGLTSDVASVWEYYAGCSVICLALLVSPPKPLSLAQGTHS